MRENADGVYVWRYCAGWQRAEVSALRAAAIVPASGAQRAQMPEEEDVTAADRLIVESPTPTGLIVILSLIHI